MSKRNTALDQPILDSARTEFLENGFDRASLKNICTNAGVTTGAVYKRYKDKEALFSAVVEDTYQELKQVAAQKNIELCNLSDNELIEVWNIKEEHLLWWFHFLYERREAFVLIISKAYNTRYEDFQRKWLEQMTNDTYSVYSETYRRGLTCVVLSKKEIYTLLAAYWAMLYEPFVQNYSLKEMERHCHLICRLLNWQEILKLQ